MAISNEKIIADLKGYGIHDAEKIYHNPYL